MIKFFSLSFFLSWSFFHLTAQTTAPPIYPDKDNSIYQEGGGVSNGSGEFLFAGQTKSPNSMARRALLHFDIASTIPSGVTITAVELDIFINKIPPSGSTPNLTIHLVDQDWGEGTSNASGAEGSGTTATCEDATWLQTFYREISCTGTSDNWTNAGGDFNATISSQVTAPNTTGQITFPSTTNLVSDVQNWLDNPSTNYGWMIRGDEAATFNARRFGSSTGATQERPFLTITYTTAAPIALQNFTTKTSKSGVYLNWTTSNEIDNAYFEIERSQDSKNFSSIGQITGQGNSNDPHAYQFVDKTPLKGVNFYRLKQVDFSGNDTYSSILSAQWLSENISKIQLLQNPIQDALNISTQSIDNQPIKLQLFDLKGQLLWQKIVIGGTSFEWNSSNLSSGIYILKNEKQVWKIIKE